MPSRTAREVMAPARTSAVRTALRLSCAVPTLLRGRLTAAQLVPPSATNSAQYATAFRRRCPPIAADPTRSCSGRRAARPASARAAPLTVLTVPVQRSVRSVCSATVCELDRRGRARRLRLLEALEGDGAQRSEVALERLTAVAERRAHLRPGEPPRAAEVAVRGALVEGPDGIDRRRRDPKPPAASASPPSSSRSWTGSSERSAPGRRRPRRSRSTITTPTRTRNARRASRDEPPPPPLRRPHRRGCAASRAARAPPTGDRSARLRRSRPLRRPSARPDSRRRRGGAAAASRSPSAARAAVSSATNAPAEDGRSAGSVAMPLWTARGGGLREVRVGPRAGPAGPLPRGGAPSPRRPTLPGTRGAR